MQMGTVNKVKRGLSRYLKISHVLPELNEARHLFMFTHGAWIVAQVVTTFRLRPV